MKIAKTTPIPFTKEAFDQLRSDKARLQKERAETIVRLQTAREMGDLSENGAYKYAKSELGDIGRKMRTINHLLSEGTVIEESAHTSVEFGCTVTVVGQRGEKTFMMVSEHESNPKNNKLALSSPIGSALSGKKVGDDVIVETPNGQSSYSITAIS